MSDPRYPIGKFKSVRRALSSDERAGLVEAIRETPAQLRAAVAGLSDAQLDTPYRDGGWTVRQLLHHVADSHLNAYVRLRWTLTEDEPMIKAYDEAAWARLPDAAGAPIGVSLDLLARLHERWVLLWRSMTEEQWARKFKHPEIGVLDLGTLAALYSWHGRHHTAHVTTLRAARNW